MRKDIISFVGCNSHVNIWENAWGACNGANLLSDISDDSCSRLYVCGCGVITRDLVCGQLCAHACVCCCFFSNLLLPVC